MFGVSLLFFLIMSNQPIVLQLVFATNADLFMLGPLPRAISAVIAEYCGKFVDCGVIVVDDLVCLYWKVMLRKYRSVAKRQHRVLTF